MQVLLGHRKFFVVLTRFSAGFLGTSFMLTLEFVRFSNKHLELITYMGMVPSMEQAEFFELTIRCGAMEFFNFVVVVVVIFVRFEFSAGVRLRTLIPVR